MKRIDSVLRFLQAEDGPTAVEYAVMLALVLMAVFIAITSVGNSTSGIWQNNRDQIVGATGGGS